MDVKLRTEINRLLDNHFKKVQAALTAANMQYFQYPEITQLTQNSLFLVSDESNMAMPHQTKKIQVGNAMPSGSFTPIFTVLDNLSAPTNVEANFFGNGILPGNYIIFVMSFRVVTSATTAGALFTLPYAGNFTMTNQLWKLGEGSVHINATPNEGDGFLQILESNFTFNTARFLINTATTGTFNVGFSGMYQILPIPLKNKEAKKNEI